MANNRMMPSPPKVAKEEIVDAALDVPLASPVEKPILFEGPSSSSERVVVPVKKGLDVIATRNGYYKNSRKAPGDCFTISSMEELGSWMKLTDSDLEKKRQAELKLKKMARK